MKKQIRKVGVLETREDKTITMEIDLYEEEKTFFKKIKTAVYVLDAYMFIYIENQQKDQGELFSDITIRIGDKKLFSYNKNDDCRCLLYHVKESVHKYGQEHTKEEIENVKTLTAEVNVLPYSASS